MRLVLLLSLLATTAQAQYLTPEQVEEGFENPEQTYEGNTPTPPRPILNKRDTEELFKFMKKVKYLPEQKSGVQEFSVDPMVDLRNFDTPVKNQFDLGYCTAFASIAVLENIANQKSTTLDLSEYQHFQDYKQYSMYSSAKAASTKAIVPESAWPYKKNPVQGWENKRLARAKAWSELESFDEMLEKVSAGKPVVLGTNTNASWNSPLNGIIKPSGTKGGGHAVAIVGFNKQAATPYFIIKNSWAARWGDQGYAYIPFKYCSIYDCYFISYSDTLVTKSSPTPIPSSTPIPQPTVKPSPRPGTRPTVIPIKPPPADYTPNPNCSWVNHFWICK